jgi:hypothetical protein
MPCAPTAWDAPLITWNLAIKTTSGAAHRQNARCTRLDLTRRIDMKVGISVKIDVTKIEKERLVKGKKGTYLDLTTFVDLDEVDQYDNNGFISQSVSKEERDAGVKGPILGNVKVFWKGGESREQRAQGYDTGLDGAREAFADEDIPF